MTENISILEDRRAVLQKTLDAQKSQLHRNKMGQFSTPYLLAKDLVRESLKLVSGPIRFLDPAVGTGVFFSALRSEKKTRAIERAVGYDIDPHYGQPSAELWDKAGLDYRLADFTREAPNGAKFNLIVCNPPYVRHHHINASDKPRLGDRALKESGMELSGLAGLYCYFLALAHSWMEPDGVAAWLIPSEFMDVNYGRSIRRYLLDKVTLLRIHRFDPTERQFDDALVSSAVVWIRHAPASLGHVVRFTYGGTIAEPQVDREISSAVLAREHKWSRFPLQAERDNSHGIPTLSDFFTIKRGLATGANKVFILTPEQIMENKIPRRFLRPILPSPRYLDTNIVASDKRGDPVTRRPLYHLDIRIQPAELEIGYPTVWGFLERQRMELGDAYLLKHRRVWYFQEERPPAPFLCTYMGRSEGGNPFNFILNLSQATAANAYHLLYPKGSWAQSATGALSHRVWRALQAIHPEQMRGEGRVYGGGLHKVEPRELGKVMAPQLAEILDQYDPQLPLAITG